jgi:hypothetical protein
MQDASPPGPKFSLTREDVSLGMRRKVSEWTYIVGCHFDQKTEQAKKLSNFSQQLLFEMLRSEVRLILFKFQTSILQNNNAWY